MFGLFLESCCSVAVLPPLQFVPDLLLVLITAVYIPLTVTDLVLQLKADARNNKAAKQQGKGG
jgi:hypothetical protein